MEEDLLTCDKCGYQDNYEKFKFKGDDGNREYVECPKCNNEFMLY